MIIIFFLKMKNQPKRLQIVGYISTRLSKMEQYIDLIESNNKKKRCNTQKQ